MDERAVEGLEEERRLAYVGITRARKRVSISYAANRRIHGQWQPAMPSRFIGELPQEHVEIVAEPGLQPRTDFRGAGAWPSAGGRDDFPRRDYAAPRRAPLIEGRAVPVRGAEIKRVGGFNPGDRVFHQKFGYGTVRVVEDNKLAIDFEKAGEKKVMDSFVEKV
jgi:DNA helicase-2/ATP-dependent DNA helicase PcrA